ncbi:Alpha/Beta hydrolase protein [Desarmillaria tabescens]|uniref:Alpha/Beta hydrolase protein n=1 Tax=Armillaria tabescens TaxID=1929756 RepID=A0AA39N9W2_ARMTA|nr:Alpha/Beta hydrolase protein [Desarmillaria tabescens]KAK0461717.1 Alpha/Beta hydrolase protein [Desarmillaria tabescens]
MLEMPAKDEPSQYGHITWKDVINIVTTFLLLPLYVVWKIVASPRPNKPWRMTVTLAVARYLMDSFCYRELQYLSGQAVNVYARWTFLRGLPSTIDELPEKGTYFLWVGPKRLDRVLLYIPGGGYVLPPFDSFFAFCRYVQLELEAQNIQVGVAVFSYNLIPNARFPSQLHEAQSAIEYLLQSGVKPENIELVGDSAGCNLILQIFSHILHPLPTLKPFETVRFRGACLISPWVSPSGEIGAETFRRNSKTDIISADDLLLWAEPSLRDLSNLALPFIEPAKAPKSWFSGIDGLAERILITSGGVECMHEAHNHFYEWHLKGYHPDIQYLVQKDGVHDELLHEFALHNKPVGELAPLIVNWIAESFQ